MIQKWKVIVEQYFLKAESNAIKKTNIELQREEIKIKIKEKIEIIKIVNMIVKKLYIYIYSLFFLY